MTTTAPAPSNRGVRSTAEDQRVRIVACAIEVFAVAGYRATPVADIAAAAKVSTAYVFRLFDGKLGLFIAAVDSCYSQVVSALQNAASESTSSDASDRLEAMSSAYIELIRDRSLIALQVHAQSACDIPEIRDAVRRGIAEIVRTMSRESGADDASVQQALAYGQLCHLVVQVGLADVDASWARVVDHGIRHD